MSKQFVVLTAVLTLAFAGAVQAEEAAAPAAEAVVSIAEAGADAAAAVAEGGVDVAATVVEAGTEAAVAAPVEIGNKICPIGGEEIGSMGESGTIELNGKIFKTCCASCADKFKANPEAYLESLAKAEAEAIAAAAPAVEAAAGAAEVVVEAVPN